MEVIFTSKAVNDISYWKKSGNVRIQKKIDDLLQSIHLTPFSGIGKPEQLKHDLSGKWSRRINGEHRIVYSINEDLITIFSLKGHYR